MSGVFLSIVPIFMLIALGMVLRRLAVMSEDGWRGLERLCFYVLYPVLLFISIARSDFTGLRVDALISAVVLAWIVLTCATYFAGPWLIKRQWVAYSEFSSVFQTSIRWNGFIALAIAERMFPVEAMAIVSLVMAAIVLPINLAAVYGVSRYADANANLWVIAKRTATNPIALGCLGGIIVQVTSLPLPDPVESSLDLLGRAALGMGLLGIGAGLRIADLTHPRIPTILPTVSKLIIFPFMVMGLCMLFGISSEQTVYMVLAASVPTAMNGFVVARQMGGDAELYAAIATYQTATAFFSIPLMMWIAAYVTAG